MIYFPLNIRLSVVGKSQNETASHALIICYEIHILTDYLLSELLHFILCGRSSTCLVGLLCPKIIRE